MIDGPKGHRLARFRSRCGSDRSSSSCGGVRMALCSACSRRPRHRNRRTRLQGWGAGAGSRACTRTGAGATPRRPRPGHPVFPRQAGEVCIDGSRRRGGRGGRRRRPRRAGGGCTGGVSGQIESVRLRQRSAAGYTGRSRAGRPVRRGAQEAERARRCLEGRDLRRRPDFEDRGPRRPNQKQRRQPRTRRPAPA